VILPETLIGWSVATWRRTGGSTLGERIALPPAPRDVRAELADFLQEVRKLNQRIEALDRSLKAAEKPPVKDEKKK
jgi:hypothetical protein